MKIFKYRGDFYIPKSDYKSSKEARILHIILIFTIIFTVAFLIMLSRSYSSASDFFGKGEVTVTEENVTEEALPEIEGKTNFLVFETDDFEESIHYIYLLQADKSGKAYKFCALSPNTVINGEKLIDIYKTGGGASMQTKLTEYLGVQIDYYVAFNNSNFVNFCDKLGTFVCHVYKEIKFSGGTSDDKYTIHFKEGEETLDAKNFSNLMRYYCYEEKNYALQNEILMRAYTSLFNTENFEDCDSLFRLLIKSSSTNITVRNFENGKDALTVFCKMNNEITVYSTEVKYKKNKLTQESIKNIKGYFS